MYKEQNLSQISIFKRNLLFLNLIVLSTAFSPFIGKGNINNLVIATMIFSISITSLHFLKPNKKDLIIYILPIGLLITGILHFDTFRLSSYLYGLLFVLFYLTNIHLLRTSKITIRLYQKLLKFLIYSYFVVLLIQQVMYLVGIENFFNKISSDGFKFNSLATEPSHAAIIMLFSFYSYINTKESINQEIYGRKEFKKDKYLWLVFIYEMLTFGSSYGILLILLFSFTFIKKPKYFIGIIIIGLIAANLAIKFNFIPLLRLISVSEAINLKSIDFSNLVLADHSASIRIVPLIIFIHTPDFITFWGKGMDFSVNYFPTIIPGINAGSNGGGLFPSFVIDNGIFNTLLLTFIIFKNGITKFFSFSVVALFVILLNTSFNSQLFWFVIMILTLNKYFIQLNTIPIINQNE